MTAEVPDAVLVARAYLSRVAEPGALPLWMFVDEVGPTEAADAIRRDRAPDPVRAVTAARRERVDPLADLEAAARNCIRLVVPESAEWPVGALAALDRLARAAGPRRAAAPVERLRDDLVPPIALWVRGRADLASVWFRSVAIVGARSSTPYGEHVTADFAFGLARQGVTVVSGGAFGIDAAAHRAALGAEGVTVIVSAGGVDRPYPAANATLFDRAGESGLIVSECPPGSAPQRHRFLSRNRLIAAFATGTVVVEAAARSGALNTAAHCVSQGRPLMVVPGPVTSAMSVGCHALLRREGYGALLVETVDDVLAVVGSPGEGLDPVETRSRPSVDELEAVLDRVDPTARRVFDGLPARAAVGVDEWAALCGVSAREVARSLPALHLAGLVEETEEGYRVSVARRRRARARADGRARPIVPAARGEPT